LRIDAHHSANQQYPLANLESILKRNRFERSIYVGPPPDPLPDFVAGLIVPAGFPTDHTRVCAVQVATLDDLDLLPPDLPIDLDGLLPHVPAIAARFPGRILVIDHLGYPATEAWSDDLAAAASLPNVFCKLSGLTRFGESRPYVQRALALFGPARLMFGSDWPNALPAYTWKTNLAAFTQSIGAQPIEVREQLLGDVAARVYNLPL
jgi:predicted TIM-barrel fold metal-dependent hydrolase